MHLCEAISKFTRNVVLIKHLFWLKHCQCLKVVYQVLTSALTNGNFLGSSQDAVSVALGECHPPHPPDMHEKGASEWKTTKRDSKVF